MTTIIRIDDTSDGKQTLKHLQIHDVNTHFYTTCEQEIPKIPQNSSQVWKPTIDPGPPELILIFLDAVETFLGVMLYITTTVISEILIRCND